MPASNLAKFNFLIFFPGLLALLLGGAVLLGWAFDLPWLTRINPRWNPMVPSTALCFMLSGLSLLRCRKFSGQQAQAAQRIFVPLILLVVAIRVVELMVGREFGIEFLMAPTQPVGHMSPLTMIGFLAFAAGIIASQRPGSHKLQRLARALTYTLLVIGLGVTLGYWLNFRVFFASEYLATGLIWMSLPTALGMTLLGVGLWGVLLRQRQGVDVAPTDLRAAQIYRASLIALTVTSIAAGVAGLKFLERSIVGQAASSMQQLLDGRRLHIDSTLENYTRHARVAGADSALKAAVLPLLGETGNRTALARATRLAEPLLALGFTGIGLEHDSRRRVIAGRLLDYTATRYRLKGESDVTLSWHRGYSLRLRMPLSHGKGAGFLVFEQALPELDKLFDEGNRWGETGSMPMCARLDQVRLLCFPQREQSGMYVVPDTLQGMPVPMAYALGNKTGVAPLIDYRGHDVLAAYGPVGDTGLGLVVRMDLAELYRPLKQQLLLALPFITLLVGLGLWAVRLRVKPLIREIASAHTAESAARDRFDVAMQSIPDGFLIYESMSNSAGDIVGFRCVYMNRTAESMCNLPNGKLSGNPHLQILPEQGDIFAIYKTVAQTGVLQLDEVPLDNDAGAPLMYLRQAVPMPQGIAVTYRDITHEKRLLHELEYSNRLRTAIVESAAYSIISTDVNGTILTFNQAAERMLWYRADELVGKATPEVFHDAEEVRNRAAALSHELGRTVAPGFEVFVAKTKTNFQDVNEWTYVRKDGSRFPVRLSVTALRDENDILYGYLGIAYDISEQKRTEEYIRHIALHDVLTGLPNRALLDDRVMVAIEQQRRSNTSFALAMMDIDRFKHVNDSMGHHIGDRLLKEFVARVKSCLRPTDTLARMGGDEFVLLLPEGDATAAEGVAGRILQALVPPINVGTQEVHITSSIGISIYPRDGQNIHELLRCADLAMYWVKEHGRNGYKVFSREMESGGADRLQLERDLHLALDNGGFLLYYQPKVDLKSNTVYGVEALLRLRRASGQIIMPDKFIPLAEETGLIIPIGQWVLETACRDAIRMQQLLGVPLTVAVNISPRQFMNGDLAGLVKNALLQAQLDAMQLELEITEGVLMDESSGVTTTMNELNELGVKISIDDFGTGYSSLSYLKRYPIGKIKIDQSFVRDMTEDAGDTALIVAIIAMGHSLNIPVVAEGIETSEQLASLIANHCDFGQGFYIGTPMPFDDFLKWFSSNTRWHSSEHTA